MGESSKKFSITDASGDTPTIAARVGREEVLIRSAGPDVVWMSRNEVATDSQGFYLEAGDALVLTKPLSRSDWYMVCATGETATVYAIEE